MNKLPRKCSINVSKIAPVVRNNKFLRPIKYYGKICQAGYLDKNEFDEKSFEMLNYYSAPKFFNLGKTQVFSFITREIINDTVHDQLLLCFRGTDQLKDWGSNFNTKKIPLIIKGKQYGKVHQGFYQYVQPAHEFINDQVNEFLGDNLTDIIYEQREINSQWLERENIELTKVKKNIIFCGHSLGGSCVISALEIALLDKVYCPVKVISFGSPRIGNRQFEDWVDKIIPCNLRVVNQNDIVPNVPSRLFYKHTPNMLHLKENDYEFREQSDDIGWMSLIKYIYDLFLNIKISGIVYIFKKIANRMKFIENHFMDNYIYQLEKFDL